MEKQKKIPALRFPDFEGEWEKKYLKDVISNKSIKYNPEKSNEALKCIELEHLATGTGQLLGYSDSSESESIKNRFTKGDVLFGKLRPYLRKYLLAPFDGVCSSEIWVINGKTALNEYIYWLIQTEKFIGLANQSSGSKMPRADWDVIASSLFRFPPLPEQQKIASFFTATDQKISQLKRKLTLLEQYKKGVMQKIFSQEIRFRDDNGQEFPKWEKKRLGDISERMTTKNTERNENVLTISAQHGLVGQLDFFNKSVAATDLSGYYLLKKDDFAYNKSYSAGYPMGAIKRLKLYEKGVVSTLYICFTFKTDVSLSYMEQYFESGKHNRQIEKVAQEGARNHGLLNIGVGDFFNTEIFLPSIPEQTKIAKFLSAIDDKINNTQNQIDKAEVWKKGLMQQMFV